MIRNQTFHPFRSFGIHMSLKNRFEEGTLRVEEESGGKEKGK